MFDWESFSQYDIDEDTNFRRLAILNLYSTIIDVNGLFKNTIKDPKHEYVFLFTMLHRTGATTTTVATGKTQ